MTENQKTPKTSTDQLIELIAPIVAPIGYEVVYLEIQTHRQKILRLFIDHLSGSPAATQGTGIGIEDCVRVARGVDEPLDQMPEIEAVFHGAYELEVSSPGVDRPLRLARDYDRFSGREARIHVFRPLTAEELGNSEYQQKNPKQKNFMGVLKGVRNEKVLLALSSDSGSSKKPKKKDKAKKAGSSTTNSEEEVMIPLPLISKANLEPKFELVQDRPGEGSDLE